MFSCGGRGGGGGGGVILVVSLLLGWMGLSRPCHRPETHGGRPSTTVRRTGPAEGEGGKFENIDVVGHGVEVARPKPTLEGRKRD